MNDEEKIEDLPDVDDQKESGDHPDFITPSEAERGEMQYREVDDLDDESNGLVDDEED